MLRGNATRSATFALALTLAGCGMLQQLEGGSGAGGSTSAAATTGAGAGVAQGIDCGVDPNTSATLCIGITLCPGLTIDQEVFPQCGFRIDGAVVDVECSCGGFLCPLGSSTCANAEQLLSGSNEGLVCAQVSTGTSCLEGTSQLTTAAAAATGATSSSSSSGGTCTQDCISSCDNDPVCLQACGC